MSNFQTQARIATKVTALSNPESRTCNQRFCLVCSLKSSGGINSGIYEGFERVGLSFWAYIFYFEFNDSI